MEDFNCDIYRRWDIDTPREEVVRSMVDVIMWADENGNGSEEGSPISGLHMDDFAFAGNNSMWARRFDATPDGSFWRVLVAANRGRFLIEVRQSDPAVIAWLNTLRSWLCGGDYKSRFAYLEKHYVGALQRALSAAESTAKDVGLRKGFAEAAAPVVAQYLECASMVNVFGLLPTQRRPVFTEKYSFPAEVSFLQMLAPMMYGKDELAFTDGSFPEEVYYIHRFLRMAYEQIMRRLSKFYYDDIHQYRKFKNDYCLELGTMFYAALKPCLQAGQGKWSNSLTPVLFDMYA